MPTIKHSNVFAINTFGKFDKQKKKYGKNFSEKQKKKIFSPPYDSPNYVKLKERLPSLITTILPIAFKEKHQYSGKHYFHHLQQLNHNRLNHHRSLYLGKPSHLQKSKRPSSPPHLKRLQVQMDFNFYAYDMHIVQYLHTSTIYFLP